jgi:exodeoxyribonuclease VIII
VEGVFALEERAYRQAPGISQSELKYLARSPAHYRAFKLAEPKPPTDDMVLGTITHTCILEPDKLADCCHVRPADVDFRTTYGKAWRDAHKDKPPITKEQSVQVLGMASAAREHPIARACLDREGQNEICLFARHHDSDLLRKSRPDRITADEHGNTVIVDLKTTEDASPNGFAKTAANFRYHVQAAYYTDLAEANGTESPIFMFVVIERDPPFAVACYVLAPEDLAIGRAIYERELMLLAKCMNENHWPGYSEGIETLYLPRWAKGVAA